MAKNPTKIAESLRLLFYKEIPKTWDEYFTKRDAMTAYRMTKLIQEQTGMKFDAAANLCGQVNPELYSEYWMEMA